MAISLKNNVDHDGFGGVVAAFFSPSYAIGICWAVGIGIVVAPTVPVLFAVAVILGIVVGHAFFKAIYVKPIALLE